jgi:hypothetical protein
MTPIIQNMRSLLIEGGTPGPDIWVALAWAAGIVIVSYSLAVAIDRRRAPVPAARYRCCTRLFEPPKGNPRGSRDRP